MEVTSMQMLLQLVVEALQGTGLLQPLHSLHQLSANLALRKLFLSI